MRSLREQWKSFAPGSLCATWEGEAQSLKSALSEAARGGHKDRGALALLRRHAFQRDPSHPLQRETPLLFPLLLLCGSDVRSDASPARAAAALSPAGQHAATGEQAAGPGQAAHHWALPGFGAEGRLRRATETLLYPGFN